MFYKELERDLTNIRDSETYLVVDEAVRYITFLEAKQSRLDLLEGKLDEISSEPDSQAFVTRLQEFVNETQPA